MQTYKRIFIIGHPGAGKAFFAKKIAEKLSWEYIDADFGLEFHMGQLLTTILGSNGTRSFHDAENRVLQGLLTQTNIVVTTDASIIFNAELLASLKDELIVYLSASTATQMERTNDNPITLLNPHEKQTFFETLHQERDHLYSKVATIEVDSDQGTIDDHVMKIAEIINKR